LGERDESVDLQPPDEVVGIARRLEAAGYPAWVVGGAVRDALRGVDPGDWDLTTAARPGEIQRIFPRTVPVGIAHGTVGVLAPSGRMYEVTTFRRDVETFGRHATVAFAETLDEDLSRRDFTINAIAWHPSSHELRDPHGGVQDLERGVLRTVEEPERRFEEDRLRVLRGLRFAGGFGMEVEASTWNAIVESADKLGELSAERLREELWKVLGGHEVPSRSLALYASSGVLAALYPELDRCRGVRVPWSAHDDLWTYTLRSVDHLTRHRPELRAAALLHASGFTNSDDGTLVLDPVRGAGTARQLLRRLKASNATVDTVTHLIAQHAPIPSVNAPSPEIRRWIRRVGRDYLNDLFRLLEAIAWARWVTPHPRLEALAGLAALKDRVGEVRRSGIPLDLRELAVDGSDLRGTGIPPGPRLGEILKELLEEVTDDRVPNERDALLDRARAIGENE
jgi:tRNA nucleotidyltransferase/poly(A) polymerase